MNKPVAVDNQDSKIMSRVVATILWILLLLIAIPFWYSHQSAWYATLLLVAILIGTFLAGTEVVPGLQLRTPIEPFVTKSHRGGNFVTFLTVLLASLILWWYLGHSHVASMPRIVSLSLTGLMIGALIGFLFSSYGEDEAKSIGKLRDWLLAGITGVTLVNAARLKAAVEYLAGSNDETRTIVYCMLILFMGLGFLLMFFQRELILNVIVARARIERVQVESTQVTAVVLQRVMAVLPPSLLSGIEDADDITDESKKEEAKHMRELLYSSEVSSFLEQVDRNVRAGSTMSWDLISKVAYVQYYRSYFEDSATKGLQVRKSIEWITRALQLNPMHADMTMKLADVYSLTGAYSAGIATLEELATRPECPMLAQQWLGYFLLFVPGREEHSLARSNVYLSLFPYDANTYLNKARSYAQIFTVKVKKGVDPVSEQEDCIAALNKALQLNPDLYSYIKSKLVTQKNYSFAELENHPKYGDNFKKTLEAYAPKPQSTAAGAAGGATMAGSKLPATPSGVGIPPVQPTVTPAAEDNETTETT